MVKLWCNKNQLELVLQLDCVKKIIPHREKIASGQTVTNCLIIGNNGPGKQVEAILEVNNGRL